MDHYLKYDVYFDVIQEEEGPQLGPNSGPFSSKTNALPTELEGKPTRQCQQESGSTEPSYTHYYMYKILKQCLAESQILHACRIVQYIMLFKHLLLLLYYDNIISCLYDIISIFLNRITVYMIQFKLFGLNFNTLNIVC